jgi:glycosyltransferase involved in cell wall biosynthesis
MDKNICHIVCTHLTNNPHISTKNNTGYGIVLNSLILGLDDLNKGPIYVHSISDSANLKKTISVDNLVYPGISLIDWFLGVLFFKWRYFIGFMFRYGRYIKVLEFFRVYLYFVVFCIKIRTINCKGDIINIHGFDFHTIPFIDYFRRRECSVVLSLHGLLSFEDNRDCHTVLRMYEREFFSSSDSSKFSITAVSSGIRNRLVAIGVSHDQITVIPNSVVFAGDSSFERLEGAWGSFKWRVGLVGTLSRRKNQLELFNLIDNLPEHVLSQTCFLLVGKDGMNGRVQDKIKNIDQGNVFYLGELGHTQMKSFYKTITHNLVLSHSEGFGLSIIESMCFGIPSFCFRDLDAIEDLSNENAMIIAESRQAYSAEFMAFVEAHWNKDLIVDGVDSFNYKGMISNYAEILY